MSMTQVLPSVFPHKFSHLDKNNRIPYSETRTLCPNAKKNLHLGQIKLLYSELLFLIKCSKPGDLVLYVGAASGYHTGYLARMFPELEFDLWDPGKFDIELNDNINIYNEFFSDTSAEQYAKRKNKRLLYICDIRSIEMGQLTKAKDMEGSENIVVDNMESQMRWAQIMKPAYAYLKFRLPYNVETFKYLTGQIYLQPYAPISTESRLLTSDYDTEIEYDSVMFDEMLAWHNIYNRCKGEPWPDWEHLCLKYRIKNNWDNIFALTTLKIYLKQRNRLGTTREEETDSIAKLFIDIIEYHRKRYGNKVMVVYY